MHSVYDGSIPHVQYVQNLMRWIEKQIGNEEIFPVQVGEPQNATTLPDISQHPVLSLHIVYMTISTFLDVWRWLCPHRTYMCRW